MKNHSNRQVKQHYSKGVTLIELMIALAISLILLLGVGSVYYNTKRTYNIQEEFARLQENARFAMKFMMEDVRMAGYVGCAWNNNLDYQNFLNSTGDANDDAYLGTFQTGLEGLEATSTFAGNAVNLAAPVPGWSGPIPNFLTNVPNPGSDILIVRYATGNGVRLTQNNDAANLWIDDFGNPALTNVGGVNCHQPSGICEGDILMVTDCEKSRLFQTTTGLTSTPGIGMKLVHAAAGNPAPPGNATPAWQQSDSFSADDSSIYRAAAYAYYVAQGTGVPGPDGIVEPALYRQELRPGSQPEELVEGVENMQILYGIDTDKTAPDQKGDGVANRYVSADLINPAQDNVVSARISLLIRTANETAVKTAAVPVAPAAQSFILSGMTAASGTTVTSNPDRRMRKVFTTTVKIRNKGLQ